MAERNTQPYSDQNWLSAARTGVEANGGFLRSTLAKPSSSLEKLARGVRKPGTKDGARGVISTALFKAAESDVPVLKSVAGKATSLSTQGLRTALGSRPVIGLQIDGLQR